MTSGIAPAPAPVVRTRAGWIVAALALAALTVVVARTAWKTPAPAQADVLSIVPPPGTAFANGEAAQISPDGRDVAFVATDRAGRTLLYVRSRSSSVARPFEGTDDATLPFWSPDGRQLGFFARGVLKTIAVAGGTPRALAGAPGPRGGTWSKNDLIVFAPYPNEPLRQVPAGGGTAVPVMARSPAPHQRWFPAFLPDGRHYLYLAIDLTSRRGTAVRVASIDSIETSEIVPSAVSATFAEPGYLLFRRDAALVGQRFDIGSLRLTGAPMVLADTVGYSPVGYQTFASGSAGALVFQEPEPGWHLTWFDRSGKRLGLALPTPGQYNGLCLSRNGTRIVYDLVDADRASTNQDIWALDVQTGVTTRLTFDPSADFYPACSPSGDEMVFASLRAGPPSLFRQLTTAPGSETALKQSPGPKIPTDWSRDGRLILYTAFDSVTGWDIWTLPLPAGSPTVFAATDAEERNAKLSPDGRYIAYTFVQAEKSEIYVQPFPATGARWQVSRGAGQHAVWSGDGRTLYYTSADKKIMAVDVTTQGGEFAVGAPRVAVDTRIEGRERTNQGSPFAVTPDGQRFVVSTAADTVEPITVVLNWRALLEK